jgi:hypothetical protein
MMQPLIVFPFTRGATLAKLQGSIKQAGAFENLSDVFRRPGL